MIKDPLTNELKALKEAIEYDLIETTHVAFETIDLGKLTSIALIWQTYYQENIRLMTPEVRELLEHLVEGHEGELTATLASILYQLITTTSCIDTGINHRKLPLRTEDIIRFQ